MCLTLFSCVVEFNVNQEHYDFVKLTLLCSQFLVDLNVLVTLAFIGFSVNCVKT